MKLKDAIEVAVWESAYSQFAKWCRDEQPAADRCEPEVAALLHAAITVERYREARAAVSADGSGHLLPEPPDPHPVAYAERAGHADTADLAHTAHKAARMMGF